MIILFLRLSVRVESVRSDDNKDREAEGEALGLCLARWKGLKGMMVGLKESLTEMHGRHIKTTIDGDPIDCCIPG